MRTDLEVEISNQCGRLMAGAIVYYNSAIQSCLLEKIRKNDKKQIKILKKTSPVGWDHLNFTGHFVFYDNTKPYTQSIRFGNSGGLRVEVLHLR